MEDTCEKFVASTRVKLLIKNMLLDRESGWPKSLRATTEIKKKEEIEKQERKKAEE
jgi:hypothetical protein